MEHILELIRQNGDLFYLLTFVWTALEGETFVIFAGLAAQKGLLNIWFLFFAAWLGSFAGDQFFFFLGRRYASHILDRYPNLKPKLDVVFSALEKYATVFILSYRFMYGVRNVSGIAIGMSHLPWRRFLVLNLTAAFVWAGVFSGAGYLFGDVIAKISAREEDVRFGVHEATLAVLGLAVLILGGRALIGRWIKRRMAQKEAILVAQKKDMCS